MKNIKQIKVYGLLWLLVAFGFVMNVNANDLSVYTQKPYDPEAFFFTPEKYAIKGDGKMDISNALQSAINELKRTKNFGILFIPEGKYLLSKTIHVPAAIRLIG